MHLMVLMSVVLWNLGVGGTVAAVSAVMVAALAVVAVLDTVVAASGSVIEAPRLASMLGAYNCKEETDQTQGLWVEQDKASPV